MLRHIKPGMLVFSVLYILLGLLLLLAPQAVADVFCIALGLLVVLCGLQSLYGYFKKDNGSIRRRHSGKLNTFNAFEDDEFRAEIGCVKNQSEQRHEDIVDN